MRVSRRQALTAMGSLAAVATAGKALAAGEALVKSYPDPAYQSLDPTFDKYNLGAFSGVDKLYEGTRYGEGPVYFGDGRYLLWSDIPNNRLMKWDEDTGAVSVYRSPSNNSNGNMRDRQGRLVTCEHGGKVTRTEHDGSVTTLAVTFQGKRLNSPNDCVLANDDAIWFTDPPYGLSDYTGHARAPELGFNVYRMAPDGKLTVVADDVEGPNGLCFSPDQKKLYVVNTGASPSNILVYDVVDGVKLANRKVFATADKGYSADGVKCDTDGNVWASWGPGADQAGVRVFSPAGKAIGRIALPEGAVNLCFGGWAKNRLFITTGHGLYAAYVNARGAV
jgi:gluconolactonase